MRRFEIGFISGILFLSLLIGCATRGTFTTIAATDKATTLAYDGYVDSVIRGETRTNNLPIISKAFDAVKAAERVAIDRASGNTNAPVTGEFSAAAASFINQINNEKGVK